MCHAGAGGPIVQDPFYVANEAIDQCKPSNNNNNNTINNTHCRVSNFHMKAIFEKTVNELEDKYAIEDLRILIVPMLVLLVTIVLFFLESFPWAHLNSLAWISLFGAMALLAFTSSTGLSSKQASQSHQNNNNNNNNSHESKPDESEQGDNYFDAILGKIEWSTLIFFASLFIVMEIVTKLGLILFVGQNIIYTINLLPVGTVRSLGAITIMLWSSGLASGLIDNVPFTAIMVKILSAIIVERQQLEQQLVSTTLPLEPLEPALPFTAMIYALIFGACLGGNGTLIGASANLVTAGVSQRFGYPIGFVRFLRFGVPVTLISLLLANLYLVSIFQFILW